MTPLNNAIETILASEIFKTLTNSTTIQLCQINAIIALLIKSNIDFNLHYTASTRISNPSTTLTIYINSTTKIEMNIELN